MSRQRLILAIALVGLAFAIAVDIPWGLLQKIRAEDAPQNTAREDRVSLETTQQAISRRYKRFEEKLRKMAELMRKTDPDRTELLNRVIGESHAKFIVERMNRLSERLKDRKYGEAIDQQDELIAELISLLDLLGSEDRAKEIEEEKKRLKDLIRNVEALLGKQKGIRADTERGADEKGLQQRQADLEKRTQKLGHKIDQQDAEKAKKLKGDRENDGEKSDGEKSDGEKSDGEKSDGEKSDGEKSDGEKSDGEKSDGEKSDGEKSDGEKSDGEKSDGEKSDGEKSDGGEPQPGGKPADGQQQKPQQPFTPGRKEIKEARKAMQDALDKLKRKKRAEAPEEQTEAIAKLQQAKEKLEEILRQLREEEREQVLTKLEDRFQQMLAVQLVIYDNTVRLGKIPAEQRERETNLFTKAKELSQKEAELVVDAQKALALIKEEGSSVAFPEAIEQMRDDMQTVVSRLDVAQVGDLTQIIEQDVIEALEDLIEALQQEIEKFSEKKQQKQQNQGQQRRQKEEELLEKLAELKMLRSLQLRINRRTKRMGRMIEGEQAMESDVLTELQKLSFRQRRVQQATYHLATGKNK